MLMYMHMCMCMYMFMDMYMQISMSLQAELALLRGECRRCTANQSTAARTLLHSRRPTRTRFLAARPCSDLGYISLRSALWRGTPRRRSVGTA